MPMTTSKPRPMPRPMPPQSNVSAWRTASSSGVVSRSNKRLVILYFQGVKEEDGEGGPHGPRMSTGSRALAHDPPPSMPRDCWYAVFDAHRNKWHGQITS